MASRIRWTAPTTYTDGRPYGQADHGGYELELNGTPAFAIPVGWDADGQYEFDLIELSALRQGQNTARIRTVAANGLASDWSNAVTFEYRSRPNAPSAVAVA